MIRVAVIDDSPLARKLISEMLESDPEIEVVSRAMNGLFGLRHVVRNKPDVVTLDFEMPQMDGMETLKRIMAQCPTPVVMISGHKPADGGDLTMEALSCGAVDFIAKPDGRENESLVRLQQTLIEKIKIAASIEVKKIEHNLPEIDLSSREIQKMVQVESDAKPEGVSRSVFPSGDVELIAMGSSTGGVPALQSIIPNLHRDMPPVLVVQHMPEGFTASFASRLNKISDLDVSEAVHGEPILPNHVYIAPGDDHMGIRKSGSIWKIFLEKTENVSGHRPSVDFLYKSIAKYDIAKKTLGVILTGMGGDGAQGMREMFEKGAQTIAQSKETCTVFGMPKVAIEKGGVEHILPLSEISEKITQLVTNKK